MRWGLHILCEKKGFSLKTQHLVFDNNFSHTLAQNINTVMLRKKRELLHIDSKDLHSVNSKPGDFEKGLQFCEEEFNPDTEKF